MPENIEMTVLANNRHVDGLRKGDLVTLPKGITGLIESLEPKQAYIYVTLVGGYKGRLPLNDEVKITRTMPTQAELDKLDLVTIGIEVEKKHREYRQAMNNGLNKLREEYQNRMAAGQITPISFDRMASIKLNEIRWAIYEGIVHNIMAMTGQEGTPEHGAALRAVVRARDFARRELAKPYQDALSRSTSVISNLEDDMRRQVLAEFLHETDYYRPEALWERVGGEL